MISPCFIRTRLFKKPTRGDWLTELQFVLYNMGIREGLLQWPIQNQRVLLQWIGYRGCCYISSLYIFGKIMNQKLSLCKIAPAYLKFMHSLDSRISVKFNNRPFVGVVTIMAGLRYVLPLTSQTTQKRKNPRRGRGFLMT